MVGLTGSGSVALKYCPNVATVVRNDEQNVVAGSSTGGGDGQGSKDGHKTVTSVLV